MYESQLDQERQELEKQLKDLRIRQILRTMVWAKTTDEATIKQLIDLTIEDLNKEIKLLEDIIKNVIEGHSEDCHRVRD